MPSVIENLSRDNMGVQTIETPLGLMEISASAQGLESACYVQYPLPNDPNPFTELLCEQLEGYFAGTVREFDLPVRGGGTPFQQRVWLAVSYIPYGQTITLTELAEILHKPRKLRAIEAALHQNRAQIVVPCHRVTELEKETEHAEFLRALEEKFSAQNC